MIFIGIGSNLESEFGNKYQNIELAISLFKDNGIKLIKRSSFYETFSQPNFSDPKFLNIVVSIATNLKPDKLMLKLISIEKKLGRIRNIKNNPRTCDLDILDYNGLVKELEFESHKLSIPHERLSERNFVLYPLKEIYPNWTHPISKKTVSDLIYKLNISNNEITKLSENDIKEYVK